MKALSIKQPWVHAILREGKDIENRTWTTKHRGWIALHASATPRRATDDDFPGRIRCPDLKSLDYSAICGVARLTDIIIKIWGSNPYLSIIKRFQTSFCGFARERKIYHALRKILDKIEKISAIFASLRENKSLYSNLLEIDLSANKRK